jgi:hypothetical protein
MAIATTTFYLIICIAAGICYAEPKVGAVFNFRTSYNCSYSCSCHSLQPIPGIHGHVAGSIPAVTPSYCTVTTINAFRSTKNLSL